MEDKDIKFIVYCHTNKINGKKYIGITSNSNPIRRWGKIGQGYKSQYFYRAIKKYGWDEFEHEILFKELSEDEAKKKEIELISKHKTKDRNFGYNLTDGGDGSLGYIASEETIKKLRDSHAGQVAWNKGLKYTCENISKIQIEIWKREGHREKMSIAHIGNNQSEETKQKISENSARTTSVYQLDKDTNEVINKWDRITHALENIQKADSSSISSCCSGLNITHLEYKWIYAVDYDNKSELYYKIINTIPRNKTIYKLNKDTLDIVKKYKISSDLLLDYDVSTKMKIRKSCSSKTRRIIDNHIWVYNVDYSI